MGYLFSVLNKIWVKESKGGQNLPDRIEMAHVVQLVMRLRDVYSY